ncbi:hypothetical protein Tco_0238233 [Tanacetum coccineum]
MDDPNIMMEEYIQLMADKARRDFEIDFTAIVYNDASTSNQNVCSEPTVKHPFGDVVNVHWHVGKRKRWKDCMKKSCDMPARTGVPRYNDNANESLFCDGER